MLWAFLIPQTSRAYSTTASWRPRQRPRKGMLFSRAYLIARILPSTPVLPNPPGTMIPSASSRAERLPWSFSNCLESIHWICGVLWLCQAACFMASMTET